MSFRSVLLLLLPAVLVGAGALFWGAEPGMATGLALLASAASYAAGVLSQSPLQSRLRALELAARALQPGEATPSALLPGEEEDDSLSGLTHALATLRTRMDAKLDSLEGETHALSAVLDGMSEGVWVTDVSGTLIRHNNALTELLGAGSPSGPSFV